MSAGTISAGPAGVKNLRAVFENKSNAQSTSPPSRGRSPNGSVSSQASRTLSKVRTSFVTVERPGDSSQSPQWRLRKTSDVSNMAEVREEAILGDNNNVNTVSVTQDAPAHAAGTSSLGAILKGSPFEQPSTPIEPSTEPVSGSPELPKSLEKTKTNGSGNTNKVASMVGKMQTTEQTTSKTELSADTKSTRPVPSALNTKGTASKPKEGPASAKKSPISQKKESPAIANNTGSAFEPRGGVIQPSDKAKEERTKAEKAEGADPSEGQSTTKNGVTTFKPRGGPSKIAGIIQSSNLAKEDRAKAEQSYAADSAGDKQVPEHSHGPSFKPRGGVSKIQGVIQSSNRAKEERAKAEQSDSALTSEDKKAISKEVKPPSVASKATAASRAHAQKQDNSSVTKQIKSPTAARPTKLPSAVTAGTAASAARKGARTTDEEPKTNTSERKSMLPHAPRVADISTRASIAKKSSRASLANGEERPRSRVSAAHKPTDESFLARMTRPTASSARRAQENSQATSPPRARQTSANHETVKKTSRRSLGDVSKAIPHTNGPEETPLEPINQDTSVIMLGGAEDDEGEPGPAEEEGEDIVAQHQQQPQQAEVAQETL